MFKKEMITQTLESLAGPRKSYEMVTFAKARDWAKRKYNATIVDSAFYSIRKKLIASREEKEVVATVKDGPISAILNCSRQDENGIISLVRQLKQVIEHLGKEDTKELVNIL